MSFYKHLYAKSLHESEVECRCFLDCSVRGQISVLGISNNVSMMEKLIWLMLFLSHHSLNFCTIKYQC